MILIAPIVLFFFALTWNLPNVSWLLIHNPASTPFMALQSRKLSTAQKEVLPTQIWVNYELISNNLKRSVLAAEDDTFFNHHGFNWTEIKKIYNSMKKTKKIKRGGSTITQQLAKNLYLGPEKTIFRKIKEAIITVSLEKTLPKKRILELYLNLIEWGPGIFGIEAASQFYYHKSAHDLTLQESAYLAAIIPNPLKYSTTKYRKYTQAKANLIAKRARYQILEHQADSIREAINLSLKESVAKKSSEIDKETKEAEDEAIEKIAPVEIPEF